MHRMFKISGIILCLVFVLSFINQEDPTLQEDHSQDTNSSSQPVVIKDQPDKFLSEIQLSHDLLEKQIKIMTIDEKIGQMLMMGVEGTVLSEDIIEMIESYHIGGIIFFKRNMQSVEQILELVNDIKASNFDRIPLFLSVDHEGGRVNRLSAEFVKIPTSQMIGKVNAEEFSYTLGKIMGEQLTALGLNMNYAPVLDINSNANNPVIGDRAFGSTNELVSKQGIQVMKGLQSQLVIPVVKHFPGHGDTSVDSHIDIPSVNKSLSELREFELIPFIEAIEHQSDVMMVAHILMTQIDPQYPATLSNMVITKLLREEIGFEGVVITDDMTMGAIVKYYGIGEASVLAIRAGNDIVMIAHDKSEQIAAIDSIKQAIDNGILTEERIDQSVYRILQLKQKYNLTNDKAQSFDVNDMNARLKEVLQKYIRN